VRTAGPRGAHLALQFIHPLDQRFDQRIDPIVFFLEQGCF
jgi:hypothetical protein